MAGASEGGYTEPKTLMKQQACLEVSHSLQLWCKFEENNLQQQSKLEEDYDYRLFCMSTLLDVKY